MSQENVETVRSIYEAFGKLLAAIHPEITCHDRPRHPNATVFHGHAGLMDLIADDLRTVDEIVWEPLEFTEVGPRVIVRVRQAGRGRPAGHRSRARSQWSAEQRRRRWRLGRASSGRLLRGARAAKRPGVRTFA
jgi:hypothetical protein